MAKWGKSAARVYRKTGVARPLVIKAADGLSSRTYADCHGNEERERRFTALDSFETVIVEKVFVPRLAGAVKPVAGEWGKLSAAPPAFPDAGPQFVIADVQETAGRWEVRS